MSHRFFIDEDVADEAVLRGDRAHQIANVLRLRAGEVIVLVRDGIEASVELAAVTGEEVRGRVIERSASRDETRPVLTGILVSFAGGKLEMI